MSVQKLAERFALSSLSPTMRAIYEERTEETIMNIGQAIRTLRQKQNMTQEELAERVGMSVNAVSTWELDKAFPPKQSIKRICEAFGVPQSYFLLSTIEENDLPEEKRVLYRALLEPLRNELLEKGDIAK